MPAMRKCRGARRYGMLRVLAIAIFAALAGAGCSSDDDDPPAAVEDVAERNPEAVSGRVLVTSDQVAALEERGVLARIVAFLAPRVEARIAGLAPAADIEIELVRLDEAANAVEPPLQSTFTDGDGAYAFDALPREGGLALRAQGLGEPLRAFVSGPRVDLTPASEAAVRRVAAELGDDVPLSNFTLPELAAIDGLVHGLPVDLGGAGLAAAVDTLLAAAEPLLAGLVSGFASADSSVPPAGAWGVIEHTSVVRAPAATGVTAGIDLGAGIGSFRFEEGSGVAEAAFLPRELSLLEPDGRLRDVTGAAEDVVPGDDLGGAAHVANGGLLVVVDAEGGVREVTGIGAIDAGRGLLVYPLGLTAGDGDAPAAAGHGLRIAARWRAPSAAEPLDVFAPRGPGQILYHSMRLGQGLAGADGRAIVSAGAGSGTLAFDGARRERTFPGDAEAREYGGYTLTQGRSGVAIGTGDDGVTAVDVGAIPPRGIFYVVPGTGVVELRREDALGTPLGSGVFSADGEVLAIQSGFGEDEDALQRSLIVAIRHTAGEAPPVGGAYHAVHYAAWLGGGDGDGGATIANGVSTGTLALNGDDGVVVAAGTIGRRAILDLDAAAGGAPDAIDLVPDAESASAPGTFSVGTSGAMRLDLTLEGPGGETRTLSGAGAVTADGRFAALATRISGEGGLSDGRGMLFLVRIAAD